MGVTLWEVWVYHLVRLIGRSIWLNISGMYIFTVLQLMAELLILIWMVSLSSLATCLLSWSIILQWKLLALGWLLEFCVCKLHWWHEYSVLLPYFQNICWIFLFEKGCNFILGRTICRLCFALVVMEFYLWVHKCRFKDVGSFEDDLYTGMSKDSS